jgi:predicted nucleic acid-binding protein
VSTVALDASVIVAGLLEWHEHHAVALPVVQAALTEPSTAVLPLPALLESYAVMTRLPPPWRIGGRDAHAILSASFRDRAVVVGIDPTSVWDLLAALAAAGVAGGGTYDAHIVACARAAGADQLVTFNRRHFERLDLGAMTLRVP